MLISNKGNKVSQALLILKVFLKLMDNFRRW